MIIKATRLQVWAPARGGARIGRHPPPPRKKRSSSAILGAFMLLFLHIGPFCYVILIFGGLFTMWGPFCYFLLHEGGLFWAIPPTLRKVLRAPMIARRAREHAPRKFLCDHILVSSGHVLLRFCLKNDKNNDKL